MTDFNTKNIEMIKLDGFKVVSGSLFITHMNISEPSMTFKPTEISFAKSAISAFNNCEKIRVEVNSDKKCVLIVPVTSNDRDGVKWIKSLNDPQPRNIACSAFTKQIYELWKWNSESRYRSYGKLVQADGKVMMLFDFNKPEVWKGKKK